MKNLPSKLLLAVMLSAGGPAFAQAPKAPPPAHGPAAKAPDRADELFDQAAGAFDAGRYPEAQAKLEAAWALKKTYDIAGNLGVVEVKLGKHAAAAEHLTWALAHFPPTETTKARRGYEQELVKARAQVGALRIRVSVEGADVTLNGKPAGKAPLGDEVFVEAGTVSVAAQREGYMGAQQAVTVAKGEAREVTLALVPVKAAGRSVVPGVVLGSVAGAALVTGVALIVTAGSKRSSAHDVNVSILQAHHSCVPGSVNFDARCNDLASNSSSTDTIDRTGIGLLVAAGAAAAGTAAYFLWPASKPAASAVGPVRVLPTFGTNGGGLVMMGKF
jgi:hypothetical protein